MNTSDPIPHDGSGSSGSVPSGAESETSMDPGLKSTLIDLGFTEDQVNKLFAQGVVSNAEMSMLSEAEILSISGATVIAAKKAKAAFVAETPASATTPSFSTVSMNVLPPVPADDSWLAALKVGGILKFNRDTVVGTVSAALAQRVGLYDIPRKLVEEMERHAEELEEPVTPEFYQMRNQLTERNYADLFAAIPGVTGRYATEARRDALLRRLEANLWPSLVSFQTQLNGWFDSWQTTFANPGNMFSAIASLVGGSGGVMPPGMMQPPPTDSLRDAAEGVITSINRIFAGTGTPVAMALAFDAQQIRASLENPSLPAQIGAANREQMLRQLGVAVTSDYPRLEQNLKQYVLGVVELPNVTAGQTELSFITALYQLGVMIPWDKLTSGSARTVTSGSRNSRREPALIRGDRLGDDHLGIKGDY